MPILMGRENKLVPEYHKSTPQGRGYRRNAPNQSRLFARLAVARAQPHKPRTLGAKAALVAALFSLVAGAAPPEADAVLQRCPKGESSALDEIACELARSVHSTGQSTIVASAPAESDRKVADPRGLTARIAELVAGRMGPSVTALGEPMTLGAARASATSSERLVYLKPKLELGALTVTLDVYPVQQSFWERVKNPSPGPMKHGFAKRRLDAEIGTFLAPIPLVASNVDRAKLSGSRAVAIGCEEVDERRGLDLVLVDRHRIRVGRVRDGSFEVESAVRWTDLSPVAPSPLREPIASVWPDRERIRVGLTDRAFGFELGADLSTRQKLQAPLPWPLVGCLRVESRGGAGPAPCIAAEKLQRKLPELDGPIDAFAAARIVDRTGGVRRIWAWRFAGKSEIEVYDDAGRRARVEGAGAQLALADLDLDGDVEIITSLDTLNPKADALIIRSWRKNGSIDQRLRLAIPSGIHALTACPPERARLSTVVVAAGDGLWIVR